MAQETKKKKLVKGRHRSAINRQRQTKKRTVANRERKSVMKTVIKKLLAAIEQKDQKNASTLLVKTSSLLQKAAHRHLIHPRTASRRIARLSRRVSALGR